MTDREVPRVRTIVSLSEWHEAISAEWFALRGVRPSNEQLSVLWAQFAVETARGKFCFCFNLGNIKWTSGHDFCLLKTWEILGGKRVVMVSRFRAFDSLQDGANDYLVFLSRPVYTPAWHAVEDADPGEYARELKRLGYYTADVREYTAALESLSREFLQKIPTEDELSPVMINEPIHDLRVLSDAATPLRADEGDHVPIDIRSTLTCEPCMDNDVRRASDWLAERADNGDDE